LGAGVDFLRANGGVLAAVAGTGGGAPLGFFGCFSVSLSEVTGFVGAPLEAFRSATAAGLKRGITGIIPLTGLLGATSSNHS
jgi:hypothetical protein